MTSDMILTARLCLIAVTTPLLEADFGGDLSRFSALLDADIPACWPPENWEPHCLTFFKTMFADHPHTRSWNRYVLLRGRRSVLVGTLGAFPGAPSEVEIGYSILSPWQRQGYATEAAQTLIARLLNTASAQTISA